MQPYRPGPNNGTQSVVISCVVMLAALTFFAWCCGGPTPTTPASNWGASDPTAALGGVVIVGVITLAIWKSSTSLCLVLLMAMTGCVPSIAAPIQADDGIVIDDQSVTPTPDQEFVVALTAPKSLFETLRKFLPPNAKITIEVPQPHSVSSENGRMTLPLVTEFTVTADAKSITLRFKAPQPVLTSELFAGIKANPFMPTLQIRPDDTVAIEAVGTLYHKWFVRELADMTGADPKELPEVWWYSFPGCLYCEQAEKEMREAKDLPFRPVWKSHDALPAWADAGPAAWFSERENTPDKEDIKKTRQFIGWPGLKGFVEHWKKHRK